MCSSRAGRGGAGTASWTWRSTARATSRRCWTARCRRTWWRTRRARGSNSCPPSATWSRTCSCEAWDHCPHTAALCYQMARLLDQDPFVLLLLRGRPSAALLDVLQERGAAPVAGEPAAVARAYRPTRRSRPGTSSPPLPAPPPLPPEPGEPAAPRHRDRAGAGGRPGGPGVPGGRRRGRGASHAGGRARARPRTTAISTPIDGGSGHGPACGRLPRRPDDPPGWPPRRGGDPPTWRAAVRAWRLRRRAALRVLEEEWTPGDGGAGSGRREPRPRLARGRAPGAAGGRRQPVDGDRPATPSCGSARTAAGGPTARSADAGARRVRRTATRRRRWSRCSPLPRASAAIEPARPSVAAFTARSPPPSDPGQQSAGKLRRESTRKLRWQ